jgi:hypothetical protein
MVNNMNSEDDNSCIISNIITNVTTCKHESFINKNDKEAATTTATTTTVTDVTAAVAAETKTKTNNNNNNNNNIQKKKVSFSYSDITDIDDDDLATTAAAAAAAAAAAPEQMSIKDLNNWSFSSMGSNNNSNSNNNNSNSKIKLKKGMINSNKSSNKIKSSVTASSATYDDDVMIKDLNEWVGVTKATSNSVTGVLLCSMIERVAKDGKFSDKEELSVMASLACQQSLFGYLIVMDCLFLSMFLPLLVEDTLVWEGDNNGDGVQQHNDDGVASDISNSDISLLTWNIIKILYEINVSFVFFSCCVHVMVCGLFLGLSSYLMDARSVLWMLVHCHGNFIFINDAMFPIFIGVIMTGMLGSVLRIGVVQSVPAIIFATLAVVSSIGYFNKIIRPLFFLLSTTGDGTWIANEEVDETLGRNTTKVLKKLLKSNNRNNTRSSMINIFDRIDADGDGNGEVSLDTLRNGIGKTSIMLTDYELKALFQAVDKDGDGVISRKEWETLVNEETALDCSIPFANTAAAYANTTTSTEYETEEIS